MTQGTKTDTALERCDAIAYQKGAICTLPKGHAGQHTGPLYIWPDYEAPPGEMRPYHNRWLLLAIFRQAIHDLENDQPANIVTMGVERHLHQLRRGFAP